MVQKEKTKRGANYTRHNFTNSRNLVSFMYDNTDVELSKTNRSFG